jgi:hypothetical protein
MGKPQFSFLMMLSVPVCCAVGGENHSFNQPKFGNNFQIAGHEGRFALKIKRKCCSHFCMVTFFVAFKILQEPWGTRQIALEGFRWLEMDENDIFNIRRKLGQTVISSGQWRPLEAKMANRITWKSVNLHAVNFVSLWFLKATGRCNCRIAAGIEMLSLQGVKALSLVKNVSCDIQIKICCVAVLCRVVMMSCFLGNDVTSVNAFYFVGYSQSLSWFFPPRSRHLYSRLCTDGR